MKGNLFFSKCNKKVKNMVYYAYQLLFKTDEGERMAKVKKMPTIFDLANWFLHKEPMTHKKLQKLSYYAVAWGFALLDAAIIDNVDFRAWVHGPVDPALYAKYKNMGWNNIPQINDYNSVFGTKETELLESVWFTYKDKTANELEFLTHSDTPWINARVGCDPDENCNNVIDINDMKQYYRALYEKNQGE